MMDRLNPKIIGNIIKKHRRQFNLTQSEVADKIKTSVRNYQRIESGEIEPKLDTLVVLSEVLGKNLFSQINTYIENKSYGSKLAKDNEFSSWINRHSSLPLLINKKEIEGVKKIIHGQIDQGINEVGYWEWGVDDQAFFWDEHMYNVYGMDKKIKFDHAKFRKIIHPKDIIIIEQQLSSLIEYSIPYDNIHRVTVDKKKFKVRGQARKYIGENNKVIIFGIAQKVT